MVLWFREGGVVEFHLIQILVQSLVFSGSGSTYIYGYCDSVFKEDMSKEQCIEFVQNCTYLSLALFLTSSERAISSFCSFPSHSPLSGHVARRLLWWRYSYGHHHRGWCRENDDPGKQITG